MRTERGIVEMIFQLFRDIKCVENQGYTCNLLAVKVKQKLNPKEQELFNCVYIGLQALGYITIDDNKNFIRLTKKGYDYIYDDGLVKATQNKPWIIPEYNEKDWNKVAWNIAYTKLWDLIGAQYKALYYISGPQFYNYILKLNDSIPSSYQQYIELRKNKGLSTSRVDYYKDLIDLLEGEKRYELYVNIQIYIETPQVKVVESNIVDFLNITPLENDRIEPIKSRKNMSLPTTTSSSQGNNPKVFISYSWDDKQHEKWVVNLAEKLCNKGIDVTLDKWEMKLGKLFPHFMANAIKESERVICIITPNYKKKSENLEGGVGYEYSIMSAEVLKDIQTEKFIPLFRKGDSNDTPSFLSGRDFVDMRSDEDFDKVFDVLVRDIWGEPQSKKPKIGNRPDFD